jgi:DNA-binding response OmpR family regulator
MTTRELALLEYLMLNPGHVVTRAQIVANAWADDAEDESSESNPVDVYVGRVRRKLLAAGSHDPITTVRGAGYRMDGATG